MNANQGKMLEWILLLQVIVILVLVLPTIWGFVTDPYCDEDDVYIFRASGLEFCDVDGNGNFSGPDFVID